MNTQIASFGIGLISLTIAYCIAVTVANAFKAWVAYFCGDDTAKDLGFTSLNPVDHIDIPGLVTLYVMYSMGIYFGWGPYVPVDIDSIKGKGKLIAVYIAESAAHLFMALIGIILLIVMFGADITRLAGGMILSHDLSHAYLSLYYPLHATWLVVIGFITILVVYLNLILGILHIITDGCALAAHLLQGKRPPVPGETEYSYSAIILPIILVFFFAPVLRYFAVLLITSVGKSIVALFGLL